MKKLSMIILVVFGLSLIPAAVWAASPWTQESAYSGKVAGKIGFGLKNTLLGWTELFRAPARHYQTAEKNNVGRAVLGLGEGIANGIYYTLGGAVHLLTFPFTNVDVPIPNNGVSISLK
jgi:hypothetical protein